MSLVPYTITALELNQADATASGKQVIIGATCSMFSQPSDSAVLLYDDAGIVAGIEPVNVPLLITPSIYISKLPAPS